MLHKEDTEDIHYELNQAKEHLLKVVNILEHKEGIGVKAFAKTAIDVIDSIVYGQEVDAVKVLMLYHEFISTICDAIKE